MQFSIFCPIFDRRTMFAPTVLSNTICEKISFLLSEQTVKTAESGLNKGMQPPVAIQNVKCGI